MSARGRRGAFFAAAAAASAIALSTAFGDDPAARPAAKDSIPDASEAEAAILLSGNERGHLEPCGCTSPQRGGLVRLAALAERVRGRAKAFAAVSVGETLSPSTGDVQSGLKADLFRGALAAIGYAGSLLSPGDTTPRWPSLWQSYGSPGETPRPPLNVKWRDGGPLSPLAKVDPVLRFSVGGVRVRAVSLADPTVSDALVPPGWADVVLAPDVALKALAPEPGLLLVAAHVLREDLALVAAAAARVAPAVVIVDVAREVARAGSVADRALDKPLFVSFDEQGKEAGLLRLSKRGEALVASYDPVRLSPDLSEGPSRLRDEVSALFGAYARQVREGRLLETFPRGKDTGPKWVGSAACAKCHEAVAQSWKGTKHADALATLAAKDRDADPECVACHTVGWRRSLEGVFLRTDSSFWTPEKSAALAGVGCEDCHGPGEEHVLSPDRKDVFERPGAEGRSMVRAPPRAGCERCHDPDNSASFREKGAYEGRYLPRVDHRDVPKERRTVVPK